MGDGTGLAEALLGLDGFRVLDVRETSDELVVMVETTAEVVGCMTCGVHRGARSRSRRCQGPGLLRTSGPITSREVARPGCAPCLAGFAHDPVAPAGGGATS